MDLKTPSKAPCKNQMAFEAEMWGDFVTSRVKNHSEESCFLSELCLERKLGSPQAWKDATPDQS